ncbi:MAG: GTPase HflX [Aigarchaeota archaeon]|nr:GTPase HflX [Aigarchaeota archaeon]MDW8092673.1 GTPase HflX [Nitrososphaerota archaeon]
MRDRRVAVVCRLDDESEVDLNELVELCKTAGYEVTHTLVQRRPPHPRYNIGPGRLKELKTAVERHGISKVIFDNEIKPQQEYNVAKELGVEVSTRLKLILEVFSLHASSAEAKLQIKLAELKYELSRAKERVRLAKLGEQPGFHGLGAYEADIYYREIARRINHVSKKLEEVSRRKQLMRFKREESGIPTVALAGYTNAGKSTLFNYLTGGAAEVSPKPFTTLSTRRRLSRIRGRPVYVTDTVGFIKNVPTLLISAFHSTLQEVAYSNLILLLVDSSEPNQTILEKLNVSLMTLRRVGVVNTPLVVVLNKIDLVDRDRLAEIESIIPKAYTTVAISALEGTNVERLEELILRTLDVFLTFEAKLKATHEVMRVLNELHSAGRVYEVKYDGDEVVIRADAPHALAERVRKMCESGNFRVVESALKSAT